MDGSDLAPDVTRLGGALSPGVSTTERHYIKDVPENTLQAMNRLAPLFNDGSTTKQ
jgi:hypothetical protein